MILNFLYKSAFSLDELFLLWSCSFLLGGGCTRILEANSLTSSSFIFTILFIRHLISECKIEVLLWSFLPWLYFYGNWVLLMTWSMRRYSECISCMKISMASPPPIHSMPTNSFFKSLDVFGFIDLLHNPFDLFLGKHSVVRVFRTNFDFFKNEVPEFHQPRPWERLYRKVSVACRCLKT